MELRIKKLLENYFEGTSSVTDEQTLKTYFSSGEIAPELAKYKPLFSYYVEDKKQIFERELELKKAPFLRSSYIKIAAIITLFLGIGWFYFSTSTTENEELGTFDNPEEAFIATHEALLLVSKEVNFGIENARHLEEFEQSRKTIFK
jgi:hypothetical protein